MLLYPYLSSQNILVFIIEAIQCHVYCSGTVVGLLSIECRSLPFRA